ncbi:tRNA pseudouridine(55) synthase TruB [Lactiplantibacillus mudanjiangensis]|uniref:tRNA pseudouridine synthase B n=1 Tax=Lactiplantibacillus mudanjiangensis TaxID=1296538 RepID=A0A660DZE0_9LACO|nr:tRNA pseudouridine(55) synthase TruB [Lactiplantibacillus mudanjiangensis]VDG24565.1 tRNA pseudouridine(55) synthase TruB [Lactobacillus sp.] [Lactiplantibacillus mudanjiangensis]VDG28614.1 tRNA pseudouridine(55) synthase TruB [Lactobacillus sp.] [Lactiplantibacillus mudanjiangensis]
MTNGILPLYKPRGLTSFDCVAKIRKLYQTRKVGHSGTLDPNVDGVLPICIGNATKVVQFLVASGKEYQGSITLGFATTTEDLDGEEVDRQAITTPFTTDEIDAALAKMTGSITQIPPMFSAVKVNGRRLYDYARHGETVERTKRQIEITKFVQREAATYDAATQTQTIYFTVACSKGTYVRTLAVDVGKQLGVPAVMSDLTRLKSGGFTLDQTVTFEQIAASVEAGTAGDLLAPIDIALSEYPQVALTAAQWDRVKNGAFITADEGQQIDPDANTIVALTYQDSIKCLYSYREKEQRYKPLKMFSVN